MADIKTLLGNEYKEGMTDAEIVAAMQKVSLPDMTQFVAKADYERLKTASDNNASEAKSWKDKYNSTLSAAEQQKQADEEARKATETRLAELERKDKISTAKDQYIASGFSVDLAQSTAEAFIDGKMDVVMANVLKHTQDAVKTATDTTLHGTPKPPAGGTPAVIDYSKKAEEAIANGNFTEAAYYTRLQSEQK
jgi:hypothetical protein